MPNLRRRNGRPTEAPRPPYQPPCAARLPHEYYGFPTLWPNIDAAMGGGVASHLVPGTALSEQDWHRFPGVRNGQVLWITGLTESQQRLVHSRFLLLWTAYARIAALTYERSAPIYDLTQARLNRHSADFAIMGCDFASVRYGAVQWAERADAVLLSVDPLAMFRAEYREAREWQLPYIAAAFHCPIVVLCGKVPLGTIDHRLASQLEVRGNDIVTWGGGYLQRFAKDDTVQMSPAMRARYQTLGIPVR